MTARTIEEMEQPPKRWEVEVVSKAVEAQGEQLKGIDVKLDQILERQVTPQLVDDKIGNLKDRFDNEIKAVYSKYDPIVDNVKWLTRVLVVAVLGLIANVATQLWSK